MGYIYPSKPVLYLPFDEGRGNKAYDQSEYKNDGTIYGAKWIKGRFGYALKFDGIDDYVRVEHSTSLNIKGSLTVMAWVKGKTPQPNPYPTLVEKGRAYYGIWIYGYTAKGRGGVKTDVGNFFKVTENITIYKKKRLLRRRESC